MCSQFFLSYSIYPHYTAINLLVPLLLFLSSLSFLEPDAGATESNEASRSPPKLDLTSFRLFMYTVYPAVELRGSDELCSGELVFLRISDT
jgi:hypothetical protein